MRFWILTAITLMLAGDVIADTDTWVIGVNTSTVRRIKITNEFGNYHMGISILSEVAPETEHGIVPSIYTTNLAVSGRVPANTVNPWLGECPSDPDPENPLCDLSRNLWFYVLSLEIGGDGVERDVLVLQPQMNTFGQFDGSFSTKVYLADNAEGNLTDTKPYPWGHRVMIERVDIKLRRETFDGEVKGFDLIGSIPANQ
jgi:hypothetical protein